MLIKLNYLVNALVTKILFGKHVHYIKLFDKHDDNSILFGKHVRSVHSVFLIFEIEGVFLWSGNLRFFFLTHYHYCHVTRKS